MTNWHVEERLTAYLANELTEAEREFIDSHLEICAQCLAELELLKEMEAMLDQLPLENPSSSFADEIMLKLQVEKPASSIEATSRKLNLWGGTDFRNMVASVVAAFILFQGVSGIIPELPNYDSAITGYTAVAKIKVDLWVAEFFRPWN